MKKTYLFKTLLTTSLLIICASLSAMVPLGGQEEDTAAAAEPEIISPATEFVQFKNDDGTRTLTFRMQYTEKDHKFRTPIRWTEVTFLSGTDLSNELGKAKTDARGLATFVIPATTALAADENGMTTVGARFEGNDRFESAEEQLSIRDVNMKIDCREEDSVRYAYIKVFDQKGIFDSASLKDATVTFFVSRLFRPLKIGEATLDANGECSIEFPAGIPGDSIGNLDVFARIDEHEIYGNIKADTLIKWGEPAYHHVPKSFRALWSKVAPTWMVITLMILLLGVWGHYAYAVYKLTRIRKSAKTAPATPVNKTD